MTRRMRAAAFLALGATTAVVIGCGGGDFQRKTRSPVPLELTGVIQPNKVTISPAKAGAGPISITVSNQTEEAHTVTLEGESVRERVGPINPQDTATIQTTLRPGSYEVRAGSSVAVPSEIRPGPLRIGRKRRDSNDKLLLP
ncbi:MAG: hypothetical protein ABR581_08850 [Thermoleophilaceae bacterium]